MDKPIFRYKFTDEIMEMLSVFSKIHEYDKIKEYKEAWDLWINNNKEIIDKEITRLNSLGYNGDVIKKLFHAGRYYFRKKKDNLKKEKNNDRTYITVNPSILYMIDNHICEHHKVANYKPEYGFIHFYENNKIIINNEIEKIKLNNNITIDEIKYKIKKTYKNRYYLFINK